MKNLEDIKGSRFYGRRLGKALREDQRVRLRRYSDEIGIEVPIKGVVINPEEVFSNLQTEYWLEIGFGGGEHLKYQAAQNPHVGIIGCEPFITGASSLCGHLDAQNETYAAAKQSNPNNVRFFLDDARLLMDALPEASLSRAFILFPDPWPKSRHHKRRIVSEGNLKALARILKDGATLRIGTDHQDYCRWIMAHLLIDDDFTWVNSSPAEYHTRPDDWPMTRYEEKAIEQGRRSSYLDFVRNSR
jgi:tRNA (guanine-N7-)-methyltransferase